MPGTTRYSATFDRTYEEEDRAKPPSPPNARRSRSQSWQANSGLDGRQYTPFMGRSPGPRSSSTDNSPNKGTEHIPTRTAKTSVKAHNNPFQFVKVGTCPLYKKAEEQLKKVKEIKKPDVLKEEEEEWQSNLDSWKSRRRKMSEDVFRRQEELKLLELEEQIAQVSQKKTKTFSEMVESRATRGRALSLCLLTSPLEFQNWEFENKTHKNGSCSYTDESGENSTVNSEDEGVSVRARLGEISHNENEINHRTNGDAHIEHNGSELDKQNGNCNKLSNDVQLKPKENSYIDSGLESISSSHRAGDTPDSGSDFSQDSNSSIDCDSPRTGVNVLEEFSSKSSQMSEGHETNISLKLDEKGHDFGLTFLGGKDEGQVIIASILEGSKAESSGVHLGDRIITIDGCDVSSKKHIEIAALIQRGREKGQMNLLLWRHNKSTKSTNGFKVAEKHDKVITDENLNAKSYEKSVESENEMYVDDFEELKRQSELLALNKKSESTIVNSQAPAKGNNSPNKDAISLKTSFESSTVPILKIDSSNSAVEEPDKNEQKTEINSVINNDNQKKNIIKVKRTRRKGVYALNVDPNQTFQDGNSTNSLFPLSPVTELPSPADETRTISSTLSSNNTLSVSNSQNETSIEEKEKIAKIKPAIPIVKENSSVSSKSESFKQDANFVTSLKSDENKIQINTENNAETENTPSLTSSDKSPQNERPKSLSIPKKVKPSKVKKDIKLEKTASTENMEEVSCSAVPADKTVKTITQEKELSESKSFNILANDQSNMKNGRKSLIASKAVENGIISPEDTSIKSTTEVVVTAPNKASVESSDNGIQSLLKVVTNNVEASTANKQSKISTSENNKPKKISQKKIVTKPKEITSEMTPASTENVKEVSCSAVPADKTVKTATQEKELSESKSFNTLANNQSNMKKDQENFKASKAVENAIISSEDTSIKPTSTEVVIAANKASVESSDNGTQSVKVVTNNAEASTVNKQSKVSISENNKPKKIAQKKVVTKPKEITSEITPVSTENLKEISCSNVSAVKTITQEKEFSESKSFNTPANNQSNMKKVQENFKASKAVENGISPEDTSIKLTTEVVIAPNKASVESSDNGTQSVKVVTNNVEASTANKQSKVSMSENNKPKKMSQKKVVTKPKEIVSEKTSSSENVEKVSCSAVPADKTVPQEKELSESKSFNTLSNNQSNMKNDQENCKASKAVENGIISPEDTSIKSTTEVIASNKTSVESSDNEIQSLKVVTNNVEASTDNTQSKVSMSENNKSKKISQKKFVTKPKGNMIENNSSGASTNSTLNEIYSTKNQNSKEKQEKMGPKNETGVSPLKEENNVSLNETANESKPSTKDEIPNPCHTINNVRDLTLKFGEKNSSLSSESPLNAKNAKGLKSPLSEKPKPVLATKMESPKLKENSLQQNPSITSKMTKETSLSAKTSDTSTSTTENQDKIKEEKMVSTISMEKQPEKKKIVAAPLKRGNSAEQVSSNCQQEANNLLPSSNASDSLSCKNQIKGNQLKKEKKTSSTSQDEKAKTENKVSPLAREKDISLDIDVKDATTSDKESHKLSSAVAPLHNSTSVVTSDKKPDSNNVSSEISVTKNSIPNSPVNSQDEKLSNLKRSRNRSKKKNANSQKVKMPAKSNEESKNSNDSLNIVFQSHPQTMCSESLNNNTKNFENSSIQTVLSTTDLVADIPPVDKIAEEMEKLILEQLEEEERAKELSSGKISVESSPEHMLTAPPRLAEPPKEKPPPPPLCEGSTKESSLKRVNSTKRIKKEMYKRRSNFLGIDNADESLICSEPSVPPPPALEEILKAEMELDRQTRLKIENEATERLSLEEKEIRQKEREIIESLESEERQKMYLNGIEDCNNVFVSNTPSEAVCEEDRIETLKCERKRIDAERHLTEEQQQILLEEKQLKEREEFIRQQEAPVPLSNSSLSVSANTANNLKKPALSSLPTEAQSNGLLLGANGDGNSLTLSSTEISGNETSNKGKKFKASEKPAVPPKPLKKKEAIRKERERLRQEQEALQREREEHRRKLMLEQEELMKHQKTHAPDAPASRLGPHPPHVQPFPSQLTTTTNATLNARENASFPSRSHHGTSNGTAGSINTVELMSPPVVRQNRLPAPRKAVQNETWVQQKMPSVRKQNHESLTESRYNQNHWLIQEAEMRRITEFKERQRTSQPSCTQTHLAEDDVCSNPPRVPVIPPTHNPHINYPVQEKMWNYGQTNMPLKKYPPPVVKEPPLHTIYPRETVPQQPPTKPSRVVPSERQEQMLSVSGRKRCSHCNEELGRGAAMIIESLQLYYHIHCFQCCVCQAQLGNGSCGTDVRVRNNKLHCHNCYSNDEAGLKFSQV